MGSFVCLVTIFKVKQSSALLDLRSKLNLYLAGALARELRSL